MKMIIIGCVCSLSCLALFGEGLPASTNRAELAAQRRAKLDEMLKKQQEMLKESQKKLRESSIKINTDIELRLRASQLAREQTEREMHCIICETGSDIKRPEFEWEVNKGVSVIYLASDLDGNYVKIDETGRIVRIAPFNKFPELAYRERINPLILNRLRADTNECAVAMERATRKYEELEAKTKRKFEEDAIAPAMKQIDSGRGRSPSAPQS